MGKIVSIHSFRGGTGKSNTTANLAAQVAMQGKKVGIVDTDIQSPGIHVLFGLNDETMGHTLNEYLRSECKITDVAHNLGARTSSKATGIQKLSGKDIFLFPSSIKGSEISRFLKEGYDPNILNDGLQDMIEELNLDFLFIDTHPGLNEETLLSISISDVLILILRPDQQDFQGTAVTVDIAKLLLVPHMYLLMNKALPKYDFDGMKRDAEAAFETTVAAVLPFNEEMVDLGSSDIFSLAFPTHDWSKGIQQVAETLLNIESEVE
jgi:MinD-like ATPase involved in chromosome partitioning or flagellar assembly